MAQRPIGPTVYTYDERCLAHDNGSLLIDERAAGWLDIAHVERPERLAMTISVLEQSGVLAQLQRLESRLATRAELELVHQPPMIDAIAAACSRGEPAEVGEGARVGTDSWGPALLAAGNTLAVTDAVLDGDARNGIALVRPPGHHASCDRAMGYCLFNNVAIAARHARSRGLERIAIVDWDVHHGNGTESVFYDDPSVLFVSLHQDDLYPTGRGVATDRGAGAGRGATINIPLPAGSGDAGYEYAFERIVEPALTAFAPELILISAGQDPAGSDPLGRMSMTADGFRALTERGLALADSLCGGRLVVALEGGYSLQQIPFCNLAIAEALAGLQPALRRDPLELDIPRSLREFERDAIEKLEDALSPDP